MWKFSEPSLQASSLVLAIVTNHLFVCLPKRLRDAVWLEGEKDKNRTETLVKRFCCEKSLKMNEAKRNCRSWGKKEGEAHIFQFASLLVLRGLSLMKNWKTWKMNILKLLLRCLRKAWKFRVKLDLNTRKSSQNKQIGLSGVSEGKLKYFTRFNLKLTLNLWCLKVASEITDFSRAAF